MAIQSPTLCRELHLASALPLRRGRRQPLAPYPSLPPFSVRKSSRPRRSLAVSSGDLLPRRFWVFFGGGEVGSCGESQVGDPVQLWR
ncbi:hypothetical protein ZWY2020_020100 [Hordeum vulgare]|nr:hypothetical protein ZWY2020_020100 [Hordeum vulgare]